MTAANHFKMACHMGKLYIQLKHLYHPLFQAMSHYVKEMCQNNSYSVIQCIIVIILRVSTVVNKQTEWLLAVLVSSYEGFSLWLRANRGFIPET